MRFFLNLRRGAAGMLGFTLCWLLAVSAGAQQTISWTGGGADNHWSNTNNWDLGIVPGAADTAVFGTAAPNEAQTVHLDAPVTIHFIAFQGSGNRTYTFTGAALNVTGSGELSISSGTPAITFDNAAYQTRSRTTRNFSANWMTFNAPITDGGEGRPQFRTGSFAFNAANDWGGDYFRWRGGTLRIGHPEALAGIDPAYLQFEGTCRLQLASDLNLPNQWFRTYGTGSLRLNIVDSGAADRMVTINRFFNDTRTSEVIFEENEAGSTGILTLRLVGNAENPLPITTRSDSIVQFDAPGTVSLTSIANVTDGVISGEGQVLKTNTGTLEVQTVNTYSGGTIIREGTLRLASNAVLEANGQLPQDGAVALAAGATLDLNGIDQTVAALRDDIGGGTLQLNGATLTVDAAQPAAFGGAFEGDGALVKGGAETWTLTAGYTNAAGRTLRLEEGLLEVTGSLDLSAGSFELAGGRVSADTIEAGTLWSVTLTADSTGAPLVTADSVDLSGATLALSLAYTPDLWTEFVLVDAGSLDGASPLNMFDIYEDGEEFEADEVWFRINYIDGNDSIVLTVIPEPGSLLLLLPAAAALAAWRRRRG